MANKMYQGDVGTILRVNTNIDLSGHTESSTYLNIKLPSGTEIIWDLEVEGSLEDGILYHTCEYGDLEQAGTYTGQVYVTFGANHWLGETFTFRVYESWA